MEFGILPWYIGFITMGEVHKNGWMGRSNMGITMSKENYTLPIKSVTSEIGPFA
jgi:hypothetical protein